LMDTVMGTYRIHSGGQWGNKDRRFRVEETIRMYEKLKTHLEPGYRGIFSYRIARCRIYLAYLHLARHLGKTFQT